MANKEQKSQLASLDILLNTIIVSMETGGYHIGVLASVCELSGLADDFQWCKANCDSIKGVKKRIKKIRKKLRKIDPDIWSQDDEDEPTG